MSDAVEQIVSFVMTGTGREINDTELLHFQRLVVSLFHNGGCERVEHITATFLAMNRSAAECAVPSMMKDM